MPSAYFRSSTYEWSRRWERNGVGPRVPHPFAFYSAKMITNNDPDTLRLDNGGAGVNKGYLPEFAQMRVYSKMLDKSYTQMQLGADIGEGEQTLALIAKALRAVRSPLRTMGSLMADTAKTRKEECFEDPSQGFCECIS